MYGTCMFCRRPLGTNEVVEHFPVGRRIAFDATKGRLWVVCGKCERWNLSPIEERWEAVETCERIYRGTQLRVATENVGLARHAEGLELVRIGAPMRPEFAAWRYGDQFGRRRRRALTYGAGSLALLAGATFAGPVLVGGSGMGAWWIWHAWQTWTQARTQARLRTDDQRIIKLNASDLLGTRLRPGQDSFRLEVRKGRKKEWFEGAEAERFAAQIIPVMNRMGGKKKTVQEAVHEIERHGHPDEFLSDVVTGDRFRDKKGIPGYINKMPGPVKLALEMALHEEDERRALEGELSRLERAWKEAEEIASISDSLLLPTGTRRALDRLRREDGSDRERDSG